MNFEPVNAIGSYANYTFNLHADFGSISLDTGKEETLRLYASKIEFHSPSEHYIKDQQFDMELQISFSDVESVAVSYMISVFYKEDNTTNPFLNDVINSQTKLTKIGLGKAFDNVIKINEFYFYIGSATHPPCAENIG